MCGIVGLIASYNNGLSHNEAKAFRDMVVVDSLRGFDSTGVYSIATNGNVQLHKEASTGATFVTRDEYDKFNTAAINNAIFVVGHNRAATRGTVNDKNAHPFCVEDNIILVQNGTYRGSHAHHKDTDVDTEAIAWVLHEHPLDIQTALQKIDAAYCLVWYNVKDQALYMIRNHERPMFIAYTASGGILFASEGETIMLAASRNDIKLKSPPYLIAQDTLFKWQLDTKSKTHEASSIKLDNSFRGQSTRYAHWYDNPSVWDGAITPRTPSNFNVHALTTPAKVDITIHTYVYEGKFDNFIVTPGQATVIREELGLRTRDSTMLVEFTDYLPAKSETGKECRTWYLVGAPMLSVEDVTQPVVYTMLFDKTEVEVFTLLDATPFHKVRIAGTPIEHAVKDSRGVAGRIVTVFCSNLEVVENAETIQ
jgi:hypothetical protein